MQNKMVSKNIFAHTNNVSGIFANYCAREWVQKRIYVSGTSPKSKNQSSYALGPTSAITVRSFFFIETTAPNPTTEPSTMAQGEEGERPNQAHPRRQDLVNQRAAARERNRQSEAAASTTFGCQFLAALIPNRQH